MKLVWLSHIIAENTPLYGGVRDIIRIDRDLSLDSGDSCNTSILNLHSHAGTHVDAPYHFISNGKTLHEFSPEVWVFNSPVILDVPVTPSGLLTTDALPFPQSQQRNVDLVLIRTGFERHRSEDSYWRDGPGLSPKLAEHLRQVYPDIRAIGVDFISISSFRYRDIGREAHRAFLGRGLLILEDMALSQIGDCNRLKKVIALPLRFASGDGAPCTVIGWI